MMITSKAIQETDLEYKDRVLAETVRNYEDLCEMVRGDSPNWTHEKVLEKLELAMDALKFVEEEGDYGGFIDWFQNNEKESEDE
jgi:hypothetical protein